MVAPRRSGIIAWFAYNPVAANLLMAFIVLAGVFAGSGLQKAMYPPMDLKLIQITILYPGAAPEEVEQSILFKIEDAINDVDGIKRVRSHASASLAEFWINPQQGVNTDRLQDDIRNRIDAIEHFPAAAEEPIISQPELMFPALTIQLSGEFDERTLKVLAEDIRRDLLTLSEVSAAVVAGTRDYEISVEISDSLLREYDLTLQEVADIIARSSIDLPAGSVKTEGGDIMLRTQGQAHSEQQFERIPLKSWPDGTRLLLGDVATITDGFIDSRGFSLFNGQPSVGINIFSIGSQDIIETAEAVKAYIERKQPELPATIKLDLWSDATYFLNKRLSMMLGNLALGALLVFVVLSLFLEIKLAFWVMLGIPVCFLGTLAILGTSYVDVNINLMSLMGFILVLGIVVDDAIIIGESAYSEQEQHGHSVDTVLTGVYRVATPATFGVLTTMVAFVPYTLVPGLFSDMALALGLVVILCLAFSLVESKWILPAHLAHSKPTRNAALRRLNRIQAFTNAWLNRFIERRFKPIIMRSVANRYFTLAFFLALLILSLGLIAGGLIRVALMPNMPSEELVMELRMTAGTSEERTIEVIKRITAGLETVERGYRDENAGRPLVNNFAAYGFDRIGGRLSVELVPEEERTVTALQVQQRWQEEVGPVHGAELFSISFYAGPDIGADISFDLIHDDFDQLRLASTELKTAMQQYPGLYDFRSDVGDLTEEFHLELLPEAETLGLTLFDIGSQVRHAFFGAEAQRVQRGINELKVMVRYPKADRESTNSLENMFIRTPSGARVPLDTVARVSVVPGMIKATHIDYQRASEVTAQTDITRVEPSKITSHLEQHVLPLLIEKYPGLSYEISGMSAEETKTLKSIFRGFILALIGIYALLAIPTKSYLQPLIIMGVIPFGIIGAIFGHWVTGFTISMFSILGVVALSGVVVNDSLILVDYANRATAAGMDRLSAVVDAGGKRFRAIILTSATTFFGLAPMLTETSAQAADIVPMAVSLAFGILFSTVITLLLIPSLYLMQDDLRRWRERRRAVTTPLVRNRRSEHTDPPDRAVR